MAEHHLSEDVEDGEAEEWEDVLEIVEVRSSNSFHVLIGSSLVQIYLLGGFTTPHWHLSVHLITIWVSSSCLICSI